MAIGPRGVGRTSRGTQVREELRGHLFEQYGLNRRRRNLNVGHAAPPTKPSALLTLCPTPFLAEAVHIMLETIFGPTLTLSTRKVIPTRWVGEELCAKVGDGLMG
jgi:hypothetical protein